MLVEELSPWLIRPFAFVFGALWGSFFNVAIHRWPRDMSVVSPPSHCPACGAPIRAHQNVPILGYLRLRGKAACCGVRISPRYFVVELASACLGLAIAERFIVGAAPTEDLSTAALSAGLWFAFVGGLVVATFVDLELFEIPDEVSIGGAALGLATVAMRDGGPDALDAAIGAGGAFLVVQLILVWSWERLTGRRGMGEGDPKFLFFIGAFLGWQGALFALLAGAVQGVLVSGLVLAHRRRTERAADVSSAEGEDEDRWLPPAPLRTRDGVEASLGDGGHTLEVKDAEGRSYFRWEGAVEADLMRRAIPFGPFLALGALQFLFFGPALVERYLDYLSL